MLSPFTSVLLRRTFVGVWGLSMVSFVDLAKEGASSCGGEADVMAFGISGTSSGIVCMSCRELGPRLRGFRLCRERLSLSGEAGRSIRSMPFDSFPGRLRTVPNRRSPPNPLFFGGGGPSP